MYHPSYLQDTDSSTCHWGQGRTSHLLYTKNRYTRHQPQPENTTHCQWCLNLYCRLCMHLKLQHDMYNMSSAPRVRGCSFFNNRGGGGDILLRNIFFTACPHKGLNTFPPRQVKKQAHSSPFVAYQYSDVFVKNRWTLSSSSKRDWNFLPSPFKRWKLFGPKRFLPILRVWA